MKKTRCEDCMYYQLDEDGETYLCSVNLDEDDAMHFMGGTVDSCSYFRFYDDYKMVEKQI